jgi:hypothetical protein
VLALLLAAQLPEEIDLVDRIDDVDPATRALIEETIDRGGDLTELSFELDDLAFAPRTRDGAISLFARFAVEWGDRSERAILVGLAVDFDALLVEPEAYGEPPDEQHRVERCFAVLGAPPRDRIERRAARARAEALACGGSP